MKWFEFSRLLFYRSVATVFLTQQTPNSNLLNESRGLPNETQTNCIRRKWNTKIDKDID
jgi:hypothetical protein